MTEWTDLTLSQQMLEIMRADQDPLYFLESSLFAGLDLWPSQKELVKKFYHSNKRVFIWVAGQRSSKTFMLGSVFGSYELFKLLSRDYETILSLAPGSPLFLTMCAAAEKQIEDTAFFHLRSRILNSPYFMSQKPRIISDTITFRLKPSIVIRALATESATAAGRTTKATFIDEVDNLKDTSGPAGLKEVFRTLRNSTETFKEEGYTFAFGSLKKTANILKLYEEWKDADDALCEISPTWEINPKLPRSHFDDLLKRDPIAVLRDFGCEPYMSVDVYYGDQDILSYNGVNKLQMLKDGLEPTFVKTPHVLAGDPSLKHEGFGLALLHLEGEERVVDGLYRFKASGSSEISPLEVSDFLLKIVDKVPVSWVVFDTWHYAESQQRIKQKGIAVYNHIVRKPEHDRVKELLYEKKLKVPFYEPFDKEVRSLIVSSESKVTHPKGGTDDICSALANGIWLLEQKKVDMTPIIVKVV